jgi:hexosaminidase
MNGKNLPEEEWADYAVTDYYALIPQLLPDIADNRPTAELIDAMIQYELPSQRRFPLHTFLFRGLLSPDSEEVITCLKEKYRVGYGDLITARQTMETVLNKLLPPQMVQLFIMSRFYRLELFEDRLNEMIDGLERMDGKPNTNREAGNTHA